MRITAKPWEEAFSHEVCIKSWQATGVFPIFNRRPYWEIKRKEEAREKLDVLGRPRDAIDAAAEQINIDDIAGVIIGSDESEAEEAAAIKRTNNSSKWWGRGIINRGEAWAERQRLEQEKKEQEELRDTLRRQRDEVQRTKNAAASAQGSEVHAELIAQRVSVQALSKKMMQQLLTYFGQKILGDNKPASDHYEVLMNFLIGRPDLPYSPSNPANLPQAAAAAAAPNGNADSLPEP